MSPAAKAVMASAASRTSQRRNPTRVTAAQHTAAGNQDVDSDNQRSTIG